MKLRLALLVAAGALLAGCETGPHHRYPEPPPPPPPPPPNEFAWSAAQGVNGVDGRADWRIHGQRYDCAGQSVGLTPETPYTRRRMAVLYGSDEAALRPVPEVQAINAREPSRDYRAYVRSTTCDAQGRFQFRGLPDGGWFVIVRVNSPIGPFVAVKRVHVTGGEIAKADIGG